MNVPLMVGLCAVLCALFLLPRVPTLDAVKVATEDMGIAFEPQVNVSLIWMAPFLSGGGYCSEALMFALSLEPLVNLKIVQHGDGHNPRFVDGLPTRVKASLNRSFQREVSPQESVVVCHSEPGAWHVPTPKFSTSLCPLPHGAYSIGRTMFETDRLPSGWAERLNHMDEVWVPTEFHRTIFRDGGVQENKLVVVPESVDVDLFDPAKCTALPQLASDPNFKFLSVFKWELRKGWDVLLKAYFTEFKPEEKVTLYIRTQPFHSDSDFIGHMRRFAQQELGLEWSQVPSVIVLSEEIPLLEFPRLYKGADAFVIPSRGEGWGRPHIEAMSMALPVIATNWSGNTQFMHANNSYLLPINGLTEVPEGAFKGHKWADPSVPELRRLLRTVFTHRSEAADVGRRARQHIVDNYHPSIVARGIVRQLAQVEEVLRARRPLPLLRRKKGGRKGKKGTRENGKS